MRCEVLQYEQKLNRERLKCRALEEILLKPTNVHRWRLLKVIYKYIIRLSIFYNLYTIGLSVERIFHFTHHFPPTQYKVNPFDRINVK